MNLSAKRSWLSLVVLVTLSGILFSLAFLQYRWSWQVSEAERERMQREIAIASRQFRLEFRSELSQVCNHFFPDPAEFAKFDPDHFAKLQQEWIKGAARPELIDKVFIWRFGQSKPSEFLQLNPKSMVFERTAWPARLEQLHRRLASVGVSSVPSHETLPFAWTLEEGFPALVHPLFQMVPGAKAGRFPVPRNSGFLILQLDLEYLQKKVFPEVIQRSFGNLNGLPYHIAIVSRGPSSEVIYPTDFTLAGSDPFAGDLVIDLLRDRRDRPDMHPPGDEMRRAREFGIEEFRLAQPIVVIPGRSRPRGESARLVPIFSGEAGPHWELVVKHRAGSLQAAVASIRHRNLAVSFGILLLLALSIVLVLVADARARRLAHLQLEFVTGVSHELRTPVTVICSAAENLKAGIVDSKDQVREYGAMIWSQGRRLAEMVQQILLFASNGAGPKRFELRRLNVADIINRVLSEASPILNSAELTVEKHIEAGLPDVVADPEGLALCLHNLISNAVKYGSGRHWIGVKAYRERDEGGSRVAIAVQDKGQGIEASELDHIFEPFYRSRSARSGQIHGTGLGLSLAKSTAEQMGGTITVKSIATEGSEFTLHFPAAPPEKDPGSNEPAQTAVTVRTGLRSNED